VISIQIVNERNYYMSWSHGTVILEDIIKILEKNFDAEENHEALVEVYLALCESFANEDCSTLHECEGISDAFDEAFQIWNEENDLNDYEDDCEEDDDEETSMEY